MSRCRCNAIRRCRNDIDKLNKALNRFRGVDNNIQLMDNRKEIPVSLYITGFESEDSSNLGTGTYDIGTQLKSIRKTIGSDISQKISELKSELSDMEGEDKRYHDHHRHHH